MEAEVQEDIVFNVETEFQKYILDSQLNEDKEREQLLYKLCTDVLEILETQIEFKVD